MRWVAFAALFQLATLWAAGGVDFVDDMTDAQDSLIQPAVALIGEDEDLDTSETLSHLSESLNQTSSPARFPDEPDKQKAWESVLQVGMLHAGVVGTNRSTNASVVERLAAEAAKKKCTHSFDTHAKSCLKEQIYDPVSTCAKLWRLTTSTCTSLLANAEAQPASSPMPTPDYKENWEKEKARMGWTINASAYDPTDPLSVAVLDNATEVALDPQPEINLSRSNMSGNVSCNDSTGGAA